MWSRAETGLARLRLGRPVEACTAAISRRLLNVGRSISSRACGGQRDVRRKQVSCLFRAALPLRNRFLIVAVTVRRHSLWKGGKTNADPGMWVQDYWGKNREPRYLRSSQSGPSRAAQLKPWRIDSLTVLRSFLSTWRERERERAVSPPSHKGPIGLSARGLTDTTTRCRHSNAVCGTHL